MAEKPEFIEVTPGKGKYDDIAEEVRQRTGGDVLLIVLGGNLGSGFSVCAEMKHVVRIPEMLRTVANDIAGQMEPKGKTQ